MILGRLEQSVTQVQLRRHAIWEEAFDWIEHFAATQPQGIYELRQRRMYVNVHGYDTRPRADCRYESHRVYVDLQYCISGGEIIEWHPLEHLLPKDQYDNTKDVVHYAPPALPQAAIRLSPGTFAIFFSDDGHMPKLTDGVNLHVDKLVIKIDRTLLL